MIDDKNKGIANLLAEYKPPERTPKVKTQEDPSVSLSETLMRMKPLDLSRSEPKREFGGGRAKKEPSWMNDIKKDNDLRYNHNNPRHRKEVEEQLTKDTSKSKGMWNAYISADKDPNRPKNIPALDYTEQMKKKHGSYDNYSKLENSKILQNNINDKYYAKLKHDGIEDSQVKAPGYPKKIGVLDYIEKTKENYNDPGSKRFVNKSLNEFENRTDNKNIVTFNPTTQLFTDSTRNIAFKSYEDAKRWNDSVNEGPTKQKEVRKNGQLNQPKRRQ